MQVIAFMDTGTGKTLVAVMLVRHFADMHTRQMKAGVPTRRRIVVCLVPTKILVAQQAAAFRRHTNVAVGEYSGATGVDAWSSERWAREFKCAPVISLEGVMMTCLMFAAGTLLCWDAVDRGAPSRQRVAPTLPRRSAALALSGCLCLSRAAHRPHAHACMHACAPRSSRPARCAVPAAAATRATAPAMAAVCALQGEGRPRPDTDNPERRARARPRAPSRRAAPCL